ncbi:MAG: glycosyltransferase family 2 protein [Gammaproteobacteria bacterium]|nr:glycosyltransferase family 2 protein [Gammaproteobacteria bacterium]
MELKPTSHLGVTVIIVNYNAGELLGRTLLALFKQSLQPDEIIVVDNASSDGSRNLPELMTPRITLLSQKKNIGFAAANNLAIQQVKTPLLALLNPDCFPQPDWLQRLITAAEHSPQYSSYGSRMLVADTPELVDGAGDEYHISGLYWRRHHQQAATAEDLQPCAIFSPCAGAALYRREHLLEAGGFDERFFCYGEDIDLGYRLRLRGRTSLYVPDSVAHHVGSAISGSRSQFTIYHSHRNLEWVFIKNCPTPLLPLLLPIHLFTITAIFPVFLIKGEARPYLKAKRDAWRGVRPMVHARKKIQAERRISLWQLLLSFNYAPFTLRHRD